MDQDGQNSPSEPCVDRATLVSEDGKNIKAVVCQRCGSKVLSAGSAQFEEREVNNKMITCDLKATKLAPMGFYRPLCLHPVAIAKLPSQLQLMQMQLGNARLHLKDRYFPQILQCSHFCFLLCHVDSPIFSCYFLESFRYFFPPCGRRPTAPNQMVRWMGTQ